MNRKEWKELCKVDRRAAYRWYNKVRKILKSKEFESDERTDKDARVIHHLIETEEQRKYNDDHYEMFGFEIDENGTEHFEYGKYVVFWTKEHHNEYHRCSEETRHKRSESLKKNHPFKGKHHTKETRMKISIAQTGCKNHNYGKPRSNETKIKISESNKLAMTEERRQFISSYRKGSHASDETKYKLSESHKGKKLSDETKQKISNSNLGNQHTLGYRHTDEAKSLMSEKLIDRWKSDDYKLKVSKSLKESWTDERKIKASERMSGENHPFYGKSHSNETKEKISVANKGKHTMSDDRKAFMSNFAKANQAKSSVLYKKYKNKGGDLKWNDFQANLKSLIIEYDLDGDDDDD